MKIPINKILNEVLDYHNISEVDFKGTREKKWSDIRFQFIYLADKYTDCTKTEIMAFCGRNHSTFYNAIKKVNDYIKYDREFKYTLSNLEFRLTMNKDSIVNKLENLKMDIDSMIEYVQS